MAAWDGDAAPGVIAPVDDFQTYTQVWTEISKLEFDASMGELEDDLVDDWQEILPAQPLYVYDQSGYVADWGSSNVNDYLACVPGSGVQLV